MTYRGNVVVVGSVNADFVISVDRIPTEGETVGDGQFAQYWGGKGANQAAVAAHLGSHVTMVGAVGDDGLGIDALAQLEEYGVDTSPIDIVAGAPTGAALVVVDRDGRNIVAVAPGANAALDPDAVAAATDAWANADVVLICFEVTDAVVVAAFEASLRHNARVILNPAPARLIPDALKGSGSILTPNEHEVLALADVGDDPVTAGIQLSQWTEAPVIVTLGDKGAVICTTDEAPVYVSAPRVVARDTTGAGDAFNGTLAACLAEGLDLNLAVRRAVAAASLSVMAAGARGGIPSRDQLEDFLNSVAGDHPDHPSAPIALD